ncbi:MAG: ion transporter [Desulforegulaceae bacterium]|nr:ion transporter [Desulforegulaceae bacterium]
MKNYTKDLNLLKHRLHEIIFEADTKPGKIFDILLIISIILSVLVVMADSVASLNNSFGHYFYAAEWFFTILFTTEYFLRIISVKKPVKYCLSFFGIIDLLAVLPTYISVFIPASRYLLIIRILRVLRIFRVLKLAKYLGEAKILKEALAASSRKIIVFISTVITLVFIFGSLMYLVEGPESGFTSIPKSIYWAIVTMTTVGYGDISPGTPLGQTLASFIMILGYGIIAVPTGIVTAELTWKKTREITTQVCPECMAEGHDKDALYCKYCSAKLNIKS